MVGAGGTPSGGRDAGDPPAPRAGGGPSLFVFRSGLLVDEEQLVEVLDFLFERLPELPGMRHGLELQGLRLDSILAREMQAAAARRGYSWKIERPRDVPAVFPDLVTGESLERRWSASLRKQLRRVVNSSNSLARWSCGWSLTWSGFPPRWRTSCGWSGIRGRGTRDSLRVEPGSRVVHSRNGDRLAERGGVLITELRAGNGWRRRRSTSCRGAVVCVQDRVGQ